MRRILTLTACLLLATACDIFDKAGEDSFDPGGPIPFETLDAGCDLHVTGPSTAVFRDRLTWETFWSAHARTPPPSVDFKQSMLIAVFWGYTSGCRDCVETIRSVTRRPGSNVIEVDIGPLPDLGPCVAAVTPVQVIRVRSSRLPVRFTGQGPA